jgi:hypothetical protein
MRKEVKIMKYQKPTVTLLALAADAIQGSTHKAVTMFADNTQLATHTAYEADE